MRQPSTEADRDEPRSETDEPSKTTRLSSESKRQRDGTDHIGAFGKRTGSSDLVFIEGILPETERGIMSDYPIEEQMSVALDRLESLLSTRQIALSSIMKIEVQLTDAAHTDTADDMYRKRFDGKYPPRTTVGVCSLPGGADIQLDVIAAQE